MESGSSFIFDQSTDFLGFDGNYRNEDASFMTMQGCSENAREMTRQDNVQQDFEIPQSQIQAQIENIETTSQPTNPRPMPISSESRNEIQKLQLQIRLAEMQYKMMQLQQSQGRSFPLNTSQHEQSSNAENQNDTFSRFLARQSVGGELPQFNGNPEDWPMFYSRFRSTTETCGYSDEENMTRLQKSLKGDALETVRALLVSPKNTAEVIEMLKRRFGRPEYIIKTQIKKCKLLPAVKEDKPITIINFATAVRNLTVTLENLERDEYLKNPQLIEELEAKLPPMMILLWADEIDRKESYNLKDFSLWLDKKANGVSLRVVPEATSNFNQETKKGKFKVYSASEINSKDDSGNRCVICEKFCKSVSDCDMMKKLSPDERWKIASEKRLCFSCLNSGHPTKYCRYKRKCPVQDCTRRHHKLLHTEISKHNDVEVCSHGSTKGMTTKLRIISVLLTSNGNTIRTYALLDPGSTTTLVSRDIASILNIDGPNKSLCIQWANGDLTTENDSMVVSFQITGTYENAKKFFINNARTVDNLPLPTQTVDKESLVKKYPYLEKVDFDGYENAQPKLLIGEDNGLIMATRQLIHDAWNSPVLSKTWLGWVVSGNDGKTSGTQSISNILNIYEDKNDDDLHNLVKQSFQIENLDQQSNQARSREDDKAAQIMKETAKKVEENRWEIGLLWRDKSVPLPQSKNNAFRRLILLEKKLDKNVGLKEAYGKIIAEYLRKGYLRKVPRSMPEPMRVWYLPHFPVQNKPGKVRIVFDAAARANGVCFNDALLQGPDLLQTLVSVLFKFRQGQVGFVADIKEMFHRVKIREEDIPCQRILWRADHRSKYPETYELTVMMFGATCSPSCAIYCKDLNAKQFENDYPDAVHAILENNYMDDYLGCANDEVSAIKLIQEIISIYEAGGFEIRGWRSSSSKVMQNIPENLRSLNVGNVSMQENQITNVGKVLGILWDPDKDMFTFGTEFDKLNQDILDGKKIPTKREVLKIVMSVYDPLGFITHFTIIGRILLQKIWKSGIGWDDEITNILNIAWLKWLSYLKQITKVKIKRCYFPNSTIRNVQLHVFADASEEAYAAIAFIRIDTACGIFVSFVASRAKVAPLKPQTIPRLELQAATLGCKLMQQIKSCHDFRIDQCKFWIDSMTVFHWIKSEAKRYKQFVAQRLGIISELSNISDWNWLPTLLNVADDATRSSGKCDFNESSRWYHGPEFLYQGESEWPKRTNDKCSTVSDDEVEFTGTIVEVKLFDLPDVQRFSNWNRLIRATAWMIRYVNNLIPEKRRTGELFVDEVENAEVLWLRQSQQFYFCSEINDLANNRPLKKNSKIYKLTPKLENGILRISGRINNMDIDEQMKNPIILDGKDLYVYILIKLYHEKANHMGHETVLNELRQRYWIIGASRVLKSVKFHCNKCKLLYAKPEMPIMGQLPIERITPGNPAFTFTGIDYFGPVLIKVAKHKEKRYGVLFTCLTTRAVHLEIAHSLSTDSTIMALRRFIARRGCPKIVYSDNGTNLKGADRELRKNLLELDQNEIRRKMTTHRIDWKFLPPASPHMGGAWERLVRSIKTALRVTLKEAVATEEVLQTLFTEVEQVLNSRPLLEVSRYPEELESLTPNHFLLTRSSASAPIGEFNEGDLTLRKQWRTSQKLADLFWRRWMREYVPTLVKRSKWYTNGRRIQVGDIVLVMDGNEPRGIWPKGIITAVYPGKDGEVRVADVKTEVRTYRRPTAKLCPLNIQFQSNDEDCNTVGENVAN